MEKRVEYILRDFNGLLDEVIASKDEDRLIGFGQSLFDLQLFRQEAEKRVNDALRQTKREKGWNIPA